MLKILALGALAFGAYTMLGARRGTRALVIQFPNGDAREFTVWDDPALAPALAVRGAVPLLVDGDEVLHQYRQSEFMGGWLLDNCPLPAVFGLGWLPGQNEALAQAGLRPSCPVI